MSSRNWSEDLPSRLQLAGYILVGLVAIAIIIVGVRALSIGVGGFLSDGKYIYDATQISQEQAMDLRPIVPFEQLSWTQQSTFERALTDEPTIFADADSMPSVVRYQGGYYTFLYSIEDSSGIGFLFVIGGLLAMAGGLAVLLSVLRRAEELVSVSRVSGM